MAKKPVSYLAGAVFLGTAIGAVVGLFTTPQGEAARRNVREKSQDALKQWPAQWEELRHKSRDAFHRLPETLHLKGREAQAPALDTVAELPPEPEMASEPLEAALEPKAPALKDTQETQAAADPIAQPSSPRARPGTGEIW